MTKVSFVSGFRHIMCVLPANMVQYGGQTESLWVSLWVTGLGAQLAFYQTPHKMVVKLKAGRSTSHHSTTWWSD